MLIENQPWCLYKRVLPHHTDHGGVMWHGAYLTWLEEARVEALAEVGMPYRLLSAEGLEMPVVHLEINYLSPLLHGEKVLLESFPLTREGVRWPWRTRFIKEGGQCAAAARVELVLVRLTGSHRRLLRHPPEELAQSLSDLQRGPRENKD